MDEVMYTEETVTTRPNGTFIHEQLQDLRDVVDRLEADREEMLILLYELVDAETIEELDEVILKVKDFVEERPYPTPY